MSKKLKSLWEVKGISIFTIDTVKIKLENGNFIESQQAIAFNVGEEMAHYIVDLHNARLKSKDK